MKRILLPIAEFFALSIPLTWLWLEWGVVAYLNVLIVLASALHDSLGSTFTGRGAGGFSLRFIGHVPFLALMIVTPQIPWSARLWKWLLGAAILALAHLFLLSLGSALLSSQQRAVGKVLPFILLNDALPLLLWIIFARDYLRTLVPGLAERGR